MVKRKFPPILFILEQVVMILALIYLLYWRFQVGITRFFDVDEFTHLHWAANMVHGQKPYVDFFTFFTPGFYWLLAPLFWFFGKSVELFIAARWFAFIVFIGIVAATGSLFGTVRSRRFMLLPMIILAFLPMPYDKFIELRPDNLATLFGLVGVIGEIWGIRSGKKEWWIVSGLFYFLSLLVLVKMLPFVAVGFGIALIYSWKKWKNLLYIFSGFGIPLILFFIWLITLGNFSAVFYSLTKLAFEANTLGRVLIMEPHLFFFPNASFYGGWGITSALLTNHFLWVVGLLMGCYRLFTPFITAEGDRNRVFSEVLMSSIFILSVFGYVVFFPLKHSQYLIPIAIFIAVYAADYFVILYKRLDVVGLILLCVGLWFLAQQTVAVNSQKLSLNNQSQLDQTQQLLTIIKPTDQVLDLDGRLLYWKDPYYICCLPMGLFVKFLSRQPQPLSVVLEAKKVQYIYQGTSGRLWELWDDLPYIRSNYIPVDGWDNALWERKMPKDSL